MIQNLKTDSIFLLYYFFPVKSFKSFAYHMSILIFHFSSNFFSENTPVYPQFIVGPFFNHIPSGFKQSKVQ